MSTEVVEIIVIGLPNSGKTTFIKTISQRTQPDGPDGWFFGQLAIDADLVVNFLEPPPMHTFDFIWLREVVADAQVAGYIVVMDSAYTQAFGEALSILQTIRAYHGETPVIVAANKQDSPYAWSPIDIRLGLGIPEAIPVVPCVSSNAEQVKETVLQLLYRVFGV